MITRVEVRSPQGALLTLPLEEETNGFVVEDIAGLDPVKATLVSSSFANMDGGQYHSSRREPRNLTMRLGLDTDNSVGTVSDLRNMLYGFFMPKMPVSLRFHVVKGEGVLDYLDLDILGRVESMETPPFAQEPAVDISMMCFDPDFRDIVPVSVGGMSTAGLTELTHNYPGTVETGIEFVLRPDRNVSAFTVYHRPPDGTFGTMDFAAPLLAGDVLRVNSVRGAKAVTRTRAGVDTSLLYALSPQSNWLEFQPGLNNYRIYAEGAPVPFEINYTTRYGGL